MIVTSSRNFKFQQCFLSCLVILSLFVTGFAQTSAVTGARSAITADEQRLAGNIRVDAIRDMTNALAAPEMEGRGTMQAGGDKAANYIAKYMQKLGMKPLGDSGTYLQKVKFKEITVSAESSVKSGDRTFKLGEDFYSSPVNAGDKNVSGDMVFVGYGLVSDAVKHNDLAGVDVAGKIVVIMTGLPKELENTDFAKTYNPNFIFQTLARSKAAGAIVLRHGRERNSFEASAKYMTRRRISLDTGKPGAGNQFPPIVAANDAAGEVLFAASGTAFKDARAAAETTSFKAVELKKSATIDIKFKETLGTSSNVAGVIEGSDAKLKQEAVVFSAHYDAYGIEHGRIYPGAADNALGVAEMMSVAEAFSKEKVKPKRSLVFLAVTGEEYGLLGARHWAKNPTWDIKKIAGNLNLDGIGTEVYGPVKTIVGYGAEYSSLGAVMEDIAKAMEINVIPDPVPQEQVFYRSDHFAFVERGVPSLMLMGAPAGDKLTWLMRVMEFEKNDYHQPGDTVKADWNWDGARTVAVIMGLMGHRIAGADKMPEWLPNSRFSKMERGYTGPVPR